MLRRHTVNYAVFSVVIDAVLTLLSLQIAVVIRPFLPTFPYLVPVGDITLFPAIYGIVPFVWGITFLLSSVYDPKRIVKVVDELQVVVLATGTATLIFSGILYLGFREFSRYLLLTFVMLDVALLLGWRVFARVVFRVTRAPRGERLVMVIGAGQAGQRVGDMIRQYEWTGLNLVGYLDDDLEKQDSNVSILGVVKDARNLVEKLQVNDIVVALPQRAYDKINDLVFALQDLPVMIRVVPDYYNLALYRASVEDFGGVPMINLRDPALNEVQRLVKRTFDICVGSLLFLAMLPFIVVIAVMVRMDSVGPILFRQRRIGENGRIFNMYKFRTMIVGAENMHDLINQVNKEGKIVFKRPDDPRVTRVGRFLRRTSLDEMPQLFNVLIGDMSLVGPRPELPWMVNQYEPWQHKRFAVPQGMTGWWQVNGRSDKPMHLFTDDDIYYVQNYSIWMDIYILLKTPWIVLRGKGAY